MVNARVLPSADTLAAMAASGLTHAQIAQIVTERSGFQVRRSSVSSALSRAGLTSPKRRYCAELPWTVAPQHDDHYHARMLRALGRQRSGQILDPGTATKLASWLDQRVSTGTAVSYDRVDGFTLVPVEHLDEFPICSQRKQ